MGKAKTLIQHINFYLNRLSADEQRAVLKVVKAIAEKNQAANFVNTKHWPNDKAYEVDIKDRLDDLLKNKVECLTLDELENGARHAFKKKRLIMILENNIKEGHEWYKDRELVDELNKRYNAWASNEENGCSQEEIDAAVEKLQKKRSAKQPSIEQEQPIELTEQQKAALDKEQSAVSANNSYLQKWNDESNK